MLLCDIGNTSLHFYDGQNSYKKDVEKFDIFTCKEKVYYINVNPNLHVDLQKASNWVDLKAYVDYTHYYETMGIDRIMACEAVNDAIVIDAGSAITVDIINSGFYEGGFIYPGVDAMAESYRNISSRLDYTFNFELNLDKMPKNSQDSISYGFLRLLYGEVMRHNKPIILTGGSALELKKIFKDAKVDEMLIFKGMKIISSRIDIC
ncbi:MAG: type III pantothenate kinase [Campylobacterota bacterium]|nr:type III pantothenate kinase [Campylobacterota bacterium]